DPQPLVCPSLLNGESQILPVTVDHHIDIGVPQAAATQNKCQCVRIVGLIRVCGYTIPANVVVPKGAASDRRMSLTERYHGLEESEYIGVRVRSAPIQPY